mgnify:CR=1 FL=1
MENQIIRTKIIQRESDKETCAALEMTEEEFQKIISIYGKRGTRGKGTQTVQRTATGGTESSASGRRTERTEL